MSKPTVEDELSKIDDMSEEARSVQVIENDPGPMSAVRVDQAVWGVWWIGTILVVLSWFDVVSTTVGWIGFAAAVASTLVSVLVRKYWRIPR